LKLELQDDTGDAQADQFFESRVQGKSYLSLVQGELCDSRYRRGWFFCFLSNESAGMYRGTTQFHLRFRESSVRVPSTNCSCLLDRRLLDDKSIHNSLLNDGTLYL